MGTLVDGNNEWARGFQNVMKGVRWRWKAGVFSNFITVEDYFVYLLQYDSDKYEIRPKKNLKIFKILCWNKVNSV